MNAKSLRPLLCLLFCFLPTLILPAAEPPTPRWTRGPATNEDYFPIAVWLQDPANATRYRQAGINLYVGLWKGPTEKQLAQLESAGVRVICEQNAFALSHLESPLIVGWMHGDEPDNAQSLPDGKGYGPPILPEKIIEDYRRISAADPSRPVLLNLGQGVAWDNYIGRGVRRNHPEDYARYLEGCDIASFDIYPATHESPEVSGKLEFVARGVERLAGWGKGRKIVWNCIECTHISNVKRKPTPAEVRSEVWMSLIRGSRGLIYFVHQFQPRFREAALFDDPEMLEAVTQINQQVRDLAPVLNGVSLTEGISVASSEEGSPIAWMMKQRSGSTYLFTVNLGAKPTRGSFTLTGDVLKGPAPAMVNVLYETRTIPCERGRFSDSFAPYQVHLYKLQEER